MTDAPLPAESGTPPRAVVPAPRLPHEWRARARWFAAELLIVVAGVLIALTVQAWWQNRENRERERIYLQQLLADTRENLRLLDEQIAFDSVARERSLRMAGVLRSRGVLPPMDTLLQWTGMTTGSFRLVTGTYKGLLETGDIRLLQNPDVRGAALALSAEIERVQTAVLRNQNRAAEYVEVRTDRMLHHLRPVGLESPRVQGDDPLDSREELLEWLDVSWWRHVDYASMRDDVEARAVFQNHVYLLNNTLFSMRALREPLSDFAAQVQPELRSSERPVAPNKKRAED